ncbi:histidine kinase [Salegentibacter salinarum]|uniref:histidine kinase n=1 Tax=Salegentibacter salinarum TaxID=447422 RepID=A0A2N0TNW3_9FLAO|nr:ATP-binding protein [Salegentibacter salinarum]PKD16423.1 histidine kinase [Salegentibacter salinarum]SKB64095.1 Signal transduction histidine kinase [Salegentibacter salinarum]
MSKQLKKDIGQLRKLDFDLANYFSNTIIPQLFVDADMVLRIFTPPAMAQFSLSYDDIGKKIEHVEDNIRYPTFVNNIQEVMNTSEIFEKEIQTTDGNWFQMNIIPYVDHEQNKVNGVIITFVNITVRLNSIKELEKINAKHNVLMFALSHDMKQPISTIKLLSSGLLETYKRQDSEKFHSMIERLQTVSNGLNTMLNEFTSEGEANLQNKVELKPQNIVKSCGNILNALREEIVSENIQVLKDFKISEVIFPRNTLRSIIYNLIHNAIKYRNNDQQLVIKLKTYTIRDFVIFSVEDNGVGIAEEHQEVVFEKYARINSKIEGTGMGLYVIKKMIESHGGKIELESTLGQGSKFKVFFKKEIEETD